MSDKYPTPKDFLNAIEPFAKVIEAKAGIPWLFTATQAAHESRNGNSLLTVEANNLFGMTGDSWKAQGKPVYEIQTKEYNANHIPYFITRPFRKYVDWNESLADWLSLITRHYMPAYDAATKGDAPGFFAGLQAGGYATDPKYAAQLKERYSELSAVV